METYDLVDTWQVKNPNPSMKIQCRLDYFFLSKDIRSSLKAIKIVPNVFSDHSALSLVFTHCEKDANRGPGFWKYNNSLLIDKEYVHLITAKIPELVLKYHDVTDKGLLWELIKMEIRAATIAFSKRKALQQCDKEKKLTQIFNELQEKIRSNFSEETKAEMDRVKNKLAKTQGAMVRSRARCYEFGEKNNKYFLNLEKRNNRKRHITSLTRDGSVQCDPKGILDEEERFYREIYLSINTNPE